MAFEYDRKQILHPLYTEEGVASKPLLISITLIYSHTRLPDSSIWHPCGSTPACTMRATNPLRSSSPGSRCRFNAIALPTCCELVDAAGACTYPWLVRYVSTIHCSVPGHARYPRCKHEPCMASEVPHYPPGTSAGARRCPGTRPRWAEPRGRAQAGRRGTRCCCRAMRPRLRRCGASRRTPLPPRCLPRVPLPTGMRL